MLIERVKTPLTLARENTNSNKHEETNYSVNEFDEPDYDSMYQLPSPEEVTEALAQEYPASFIPIDVSSFQRMSSFRRSLIHGDQEIPRRRISSRGKRAKRRNTFHETGKSATTERPSKHHSQRERRNSDPSSLNRIDEGCQTERTEEAIYSTGRVVSLGRDAKRRSFVGNKLEFRAEVHREDDKSDIFCGSMITVNSISTSSGRLGPNSSSIIGNGNSVSVGVGRSPSSGKDPSSSSLLTSSDVSGTSGITVVERKSSSGQLQSEKQQQLPSVDEVKTYLTSDGIKMRDGPTAKGPGDDGRSSSGNWSASSSTHASVDSDSLAGKCMAGDRVHRQLRQNHHRELENCPPPGSPSGSSLGKDSVLSESLTLMTQQDTDRGGYTAADSNGYVSDTSAISSSYARSRADRPSGLEKSREETQYSAIYGREPVVVTRSTKSGLPSIRSSNRRSPQSHNDRSIRFANRDSESWVKYFDGSNETLTPDEINHCEINKNNKKSESTAINDSALHPHPTPHHHHHQHRSMIHSNQQGNDFAHIDDEAESVYSVDTDGYYTSMHTDSGLFRDIKSFGPVNSIEDRGSSVVSPSCESGTLTSPATSSRGDSKCHHGAIRHRASSVSSNSTIGDMSLTSMYSKTDTESGTIGLSPSVTASSPSNKPQSDNQPQIKKTSPVKPTRSPISKTSNGNDSKSASKTWSARIIPPPPPVRVSSIRRVNNDTTANSYKKSGADHYDIAGNQRPKSLIVNNGSHGRNSNSCSEFDYTSINVLSSSSSRLESRSHSRSSSPSARNQSESEQSDKLGERVRSKTCIGSADYPSLCNVTSSSASSSSSSSANSSKASSSSSEACDQLSSNGTSSDGSIDINNLVDVNEKQGTCKENQQTPSNKKESKSKKKLFGSYKPFKIREIFSFGTLNKKSKISPISVDDRKGFMSYESILTDPKGESDCNNVRSLSRRSSGSESIPGYQQHQKLEKSSTGQSSGDLYKSQSFEKNLATLRKVDSNPYLPKPITDQGFFQSLLRTDFRSKSEEEIENDKNRRNSAHKETTPCDIGSSPQDKMTSNHESTALSVIAQNNKEYKDSQQSEILDSNNYARPSTLILPYKIKQRQVKVQFDSSGKVLYPLNSLGRRRDDHPMAYLERIKKMEEESKKWSTLPKPKVDDACVISPRSTTSTLPATSDAPMIKSPKMNQCNKLIMNKKSAEQTTKAKKIASDSVNSNCENQTFFTPPPKIAPTLGPLSSTPQRPVHRVQILSPTEVESKPTTPTTPSTVVGRVGPPTFPKPRINIYRHSFSGLGSLERRTAQDALNVNTSPINPSLHSDLPSPISSLISQGGVKSKLSTSDLISLIHDSKRKLGKRSTSDGSPSPITSPQSEPLPSPPNLLSPNQRRSWSFTKDMTNGLDIVVPGCRRSLASDRLGPLKQTSIQDFKKLIAAARPVGSTQKPSISAKDLLQAVPITTISSVNNSRPTTPLTTTSSMTNNLISELSQHQPHLQSATSATTTSSLSLSISPSSSLPSPPLSSTTSSSSLASPQSPPSLSPSNVSHSFHSKSSSSSPSSTSSSLRESRTRVINGRLYRSPYRLEVMCPPIEEDDIMEESTVNYNQKQVINSSSLPSSAPFQIISSDNRNIRNGLTFIGSKEMERRSVSSGLYNGSTSIDTMSPATPTSKTTTPTSPVKATSTWV